MAEVVKTWTFNSTLEDWVLSDTGDVTMSRITDDGDPDNGCLQGLTLGRNNDGTGQAQWSGNYIDLGVPSDAEVNGVSLKLRRKVEYWDTANHGHWKVESTPGTLVNQQNESGLAAWAEITGNTITGLTLAPNTALTITLSCDLDVANGKTAGITFRWDTIELTVDYTPAFEAPQITTNNETNLGSSTATINGNLDSLGDATTVDVYFEWKEVAAPTWNETTKVERSATGTFDEDITGLTLDTDHEFRACVDYTAEETLYTVTGSTIGFRTLDFVEPTVTTNAADPVGYDSATLNGNLTSLGDATTVDVFFEYRVKGSEDEWNAIAPQTKTVTGTFTADITGLTLDIEYEFKAIVSYLNNGTQLVEGSTLDFTTYFVAPTVTTNAADPIGSDTATLNGDLTSLGDATTVDVFFEYRKDGAESWTSTTKQTKTVTGTFNQALTGLDQYTDYEFRAVSEFDMQGTLTNTYGSILTFKTSIYNGALIERIPDGRIIVADSSPHNDTVDLTVDTEYSYQAEVYVNGVLQTNYTLTAELDLKTVPASVKLEWGSG